MRIPVVIILLIIMFPQCTFAQKCKVRFEPHVGNKPMIIDEKYPVGGDDTIEIKSLKFYISDVEFLNNGSVVWKESNVHRLVDAEKARSMLIEYDFKQPLLFNQIRFSIGVDSITNQAGALGGDLDPTQGMYWTWQNGYINFKLEGNATRGNKDQQAFEYHIGGYSAPYNTLQQVTLTIVDKDEIVIITDIEKLISNLDMKRIHHVMSPCAEAVTISRLLRSIFTVSK